MNTSYRYDLHLHSAASADCRTSYRDLVRMTRRRGLSGIALTDHDTMEGYYRLRDIWPRDEQQLIPGCERTLADGSHLIGLFLEHPPVGTHVRDVVEEIRAQGGIVYLPHPFRRYSGILSAASGLTTDERNWIVEQADFIEVYNSKCTMEENREALELLTQHPRAFAASSDAHFTHEIGLGYTEFSEPLAPKAHNTVACFAPPAASAKRLADLRIGNESPFRTIIRRALKTCGLFETVRAIRHQSMTHTSIRWEKYR